MPTLTDLERDQAYRACCLAVSAAGDERESLYLARLALLLIEAVGDLPRCLAAIAAAGQELPSPSMSKREPVAAGERSAVGDSGPR